MSRVEKPDQASVSIALNACSGLREVSYGKLIHGFVKKCNQMDSDLFVGSALTDMYSKCGRMGDALSHGEPDLALGFFLRMFMEGSVSPDSVTLVSVLSACSQLLNVMTGCCIHGFVIKMGFENGLSVCNALLNFYAKTGSVDAAAMLFKEMKDKDVISWASMVSCYAHNGAANEAISLFNEMTCKRIEPNSVSVISAL
ncbi:putative pentatricopeptide repeat-containing protein, partial [Tanacetum coccineum]